MSCTASADATEPNRVEIPVDQQPTPWHGQGGEARAAAEKRYAAPKSSLFRATVHGETASRYAAVPLKDGTILQVKPHKTTYESKTAWQRSVIEQLGEGVFISFTTESRAAGPPNDVKRLLVVARKAGYYTKNLKRASRNYVRLQEYIHMVGMAKATAEVATNAGMKFGTIGANAHANRYTGYVSDLTKWRDENPNSFYRLDEAPLAWCDGGNMRPIGFVRDFGTTQLVNDKGIMGKTLAEIGVPADAKLHLVQRKVVVQTSYQAI